MKRWTVVLKTAGSQNHTGEYAIAVRAYDRVEAEDKAQAEFKIRDQKRHKPSAEARVHEPEVKDVICWF